MVHSDQILSYLRLNKNSLKKKYHLTKIGVFGSVARGDQQASSDLDLLVEFEDNTPNLYEVKLALKQEIQSKFDLSVDICREKYINKIFKEQILSEAIYA